VELLASLRDILLENTDLLARGQDALWTPGRILVRRGAAPTRRRYSIAHEIVHSILAEYDEAADFSTMSTTDKKRAEGELEFLCQVGAAELLMPYQSYLSQMGVGMPRLRAILTLAADFAVSPEAAARRAVDLGPGKCAVLFAKRWHEGAPLAFARRLVGPTPRVAPSSGDLVVVRYHPSPDFSSIRIAIDEPIPRTFHAYRAISDAETRPARDHLRHNVSAWPTYPEFGKVLMEVLPLPLRKSPIELMILIHLVTTA
jgi:hypothetical protein